MNSAAPLPQAARQRRRAWWLLCLAVLAVHLLLGQRLLQSRLGAGAGDGPPPAFEVAFVRELATAAPPVIVPPPAAPARALAPPPAASAAASTPEDREPVSPVQAVASTPPAASEPLGAASAVTATASAEATSAAVAAAPASAAASAPLAFDWPPSTRLLYTLTGWFRGELHGRAQVDWLRQGERYQVRLTVGVPGMLERRMLSEGLLTSGGLSPRRYDQETDVVLAGTRRETMRFEPDTVQLVNGKTVPSLPGVQDTASQFVQMTWRFLTRPQDVQVGAVVELPLALPRRVGLWTYDVVQEAPLSLPFDPQVPTFHLKPRPDGRRPNELAAEMWVAPGLQYLPVRIIIRQDAQSYLQLDLNSRPLQAP